MQLPRMACTQEKERVSNNVLEIDDPPKFRKQVANFQLEKPLATASIKFENGENTLAEHLVVLKSLTGPMEGLHFLRNNFVVI